jgi:hypothetical protein
LLSLLGRALERTACLRQEDVVEAGCVQLKLLDLDSCRVESADDLCELLRAALEEYGDALGRAARRLAEALEDAGDRGGVGAVTRDLGVPSATILPWSMIPTRSARTSASSRY